MVLCYTKSFFVPVFTPYILQLCVLWTKQPGQYRYADEMCFYETVKTHFIQQKALYEVLAFFMELLSLTPDSSW